MATYTDNYNLKKPATTDLYNIADDNGNMDIIDEALGEHDKALCRTNLLDNWYLCNAVNQRGQTSWGASYTGITVDRWKKTGTTHPVYFDEDGYGLYIGSGSTSGRTSIIQILDRKTFDSLKYQNFTVTVACSNLSGSTVTLCYAGDGWSPYESNFTLHTGINSFRFRADGDGDYDDVPPFIGVRVASANDSVYIDAVKLEIGDTQTLGKYVGGSVVMNDVPKYGEQLLRCKRFYQVIAGGVFPGKVRTNGESNYQLFVCLPLQVDMDESISSVMVSSSINSTHWNIADGSAASIDGVYKATNSWIGSPNNPTNGCYYVSCSGDIGSSHSNKFGFATGLTVILSTE